MGTQVADELQPSLNFGTLQIKVFVNRLHKPTPSSGAISIGIDMVEVTSMFMVMVAVTVITSIWLSITFARCTNIKL